MSIDQIRELHGRLCPYYCDGSKRGMGAFIAAICADSGVSLERVSHAWRTQHSWVGFHTAVYS